MKPWLATLTFFACQREEPPPRPTPPPPVPIPTVVDARRVAADADPADPCPISIHLSRDAITVGTRAGGCSAGHDDFAWLDLELRRQFFVDANNPRSIQCGTAIELAADAGVSYQGVIQAMDVAIRVGFVDVGLTDPMGLTVQVDNPTTQPRHCPKRLTPAR